VGIIKENGATQTFQRIHVSGTINVINAAFTAGVKRFIYVSAIGAADDAPSQYSKTKAAAENTVATSGLSYVILRPSIILGRDGEFVDQMRDLINHGGLPGKLPCPFIPVPGNGNNRFQPVYIDDLCRCVLAALTKAAAANQIIDIGGASQLSFNSLLEGFARNLGVKKPLVHAPIPLLMLVAPLMQLLPNAPVTRDQLRNLRRDNICNLTKMKGILGVDPIGFDEALALSLPR